jgi:hypothetical protein
MKPKMSKLEECDKQIQDEYGIRSLNRYLFIISKSMYYGINNLEKDDSYNINDIDDMKHLYISYFNRSRVYDDNIDYNVKKTYFENDYLGLESQERLEYIISQGLYFGIKSLESVEVTGEWEKSILQDMKKLYNVRCEKLFKMKVSEYH